MPMNFIGLGERVRHKRKELHITQAKLAELCDVSVPFIGHIERGSRSPSLESLLTISKVLKVTPDYLLQDYLDFDHDNLMNPTISSADIQSLNKIAKILKESSKDWDDE